MSKKLVWSGPEKRVVVGERWETRSHFFKCHFASNGSQPALEVLAVLLMDLVLVVTLGGRRKSMISAIPHS
jgi:hypothetical protein